MLDKERGGNEQSYIFLPLLRYIVVFIQFKQSKGLHLRRSKDILSAHNPLYWYEANQALSHGKCE